MGDERRDDDLAHRQERSARPRRLADHRRYLRHVLHPGSLGQVPPVRGRAGPGRRPQGRRQEERQGQEGKEGDDAEKKDDDEDDEDKDGRKYPDGFKPKKLPEPLKIDLEDIEDRTKRLTIHASSIGDAVLTEDGETLLYLARFEKGMDLWSYKHRENKVKLLAKLGARRAGGLVLDAKEKNLFILADGSIKKIDVDKGAPKPVSLSATMELNAALERDYMFEHVWRQTYKKFYKKDMHGVDWKFYKKQYSRFLPWINNNYDFADLLSEMLGELNASHTGSRHRATRAGSDATAARAPSLTRRTRETGLKSWRSSPRVPWSRPRQVSPRA